MYAFANTKGSQKAFNRYAFAAVSEFLRHLPIYTILEFMTSYTSSSHIGLCYNQRVPSGSGEETEKETHKKRIREIREKEFPSCFMAWHEPTHPHPPVWT